MNLLEIEQDLSCEFYDAFLNNTRAFIKLFDNLIQKEQFIMLPGDEIVEKKHKNVKHLLAMERNTDLSRSATRKFPGLGQTIFKVDFEKQFSEIYGEKNQEKERPLTGASGAKSVTNDEDKNEISHEVEIKNTPHHKSIIKARNENYLQFKTRFQQSIDEIMANFDGERKEEIRFNQYWNENLKEITVKHI